MSVSFQWLGNDIRLEENNDGYDNLDKYQYKCDTLESWAEKIEENLD